MLYENRQSQITTIRFKIKNQRTRVFYFGANYLMAFGFMLPFYLEDSDQLELRKLVLKVGVISWERYHLSLFPEDPLPYHRFLQPGHVCPA